MADDEELTPAQAAAILRVDEQTARRWFDSGLLSGYRTSPGRGGHRRIYRSSVTRLLAARERPPAE